MQSWLTRLTGSRVRGGCRPVRAMSLVPQKPSEPRQHAAAPGRNRRLGGTAPRAVEKVVSVVSTKSSPLPDGDAWRRLTKLSSCPSLGRTVLARGRGNLIKSFAVAMLSQAQESESRHECLEAPAKAFTITVLPPTGHEAVEGDEGSRAPSLSVLLAERSKLKSARSKRHGPALWWSSQEQRLERTVRDLDYPDDTELELSSLLENSKFLEDSVRTAHMCLDG